MATAAETSSGGTGPPSRTGTPSKSSTRGGTGTPGQVVTPSKSSTRGGSRPSSVSSTPSRTGPPQKRSAQRNEGKTASTPSISISQPVPAVTDSSRDNEKKLVQYIQEHFSVGASIGDGSCLYHSILWLVDNDYENNKGKRVYDLCEALAEATCLIPVYGKDGRVYCSLYDKIVDLHELRRAFFQIDFEGPSSKSEDEVDPKNRWPSFLHHLIDNPALSPEKDVIYRYLRHFKGSSCSGGLWGQNFSINLLSYFLKINIITLHHSRSQEGEERIIPSPFIYSTSRETPTIFLKSVPGHFDPYYWKQGREKIFSFGELLNLFGQKNNYFRTLQPNTDFNSL